MPSQSQPSQPILPTVVVPLPPAILTNPEAENDDEELELANLEQEDSTAPPVQSSSSKKQKTGKKKKPGENPDDEDSPGSFPRNEPAASSNFNPNNPVNLPTCRCNSTVSRNYSLTFQLHPALEVQNYAVH